MHEDKIREYLQYEQRLSPAQIEDFMLEYSYLTDSERSHLIYDMVGKDLYKEYPVDIKTFIHDPYFLGTLYSEIIFPIWEETLCEIYPAPFCKKYNEALLSCATRSGKSTSIIISALYELYLILCAVSPSVTFGLKNTANMTFCFLSKDNSTACSQLGEDMHKGLSMAPYFKDTITKNLSYSTLNKKGVQITDNVFLKASKKINVITNT